MPPNPLGTSSDGSGHRARLRQRLFEGGPDALLDHELVEYLLALAIPRRDTKPLAKQLLHDFGGIGALLEADAATIAGSARSARAPAALKIASLGAAPCSRRRSGTGPSSLLAGIARLSARRHGASRSSGSASLFLNSRTC